MTDTLIQAAMIVLCLYVAWLVSRPDIDKVSGCQDCETESCTDCEHHEWREG